MVANHIPWDLIATILVAVIGSSWFSNIISQRHNGYQLLASRIDALADRLEEADAIDCRVRILNFADSIKTGQLHSEESYDQVLTDIDTYEKYCQDHPKFPNNKTVISIALIKSTYKGRLQKHDFL